MKANRLCFVAYAKTSSVIQLFGPGQRCVFPTLGCRSGERDGRRGRPDRRPLGAYPLFGVGFRHFVAFEYCCAAFPALYFTSRVFGRRSRPATLAADDQRLASAGGRCAGIPGLPRHALPRHAPDRFARLGRGLRLQRARLDRADPGCGP